MFTADNLRFFLEVARAQRLAEAARVLEVDHTTVGRRITALERALGQRLFDRSPNGWRLTDAGKRLLPRAEVVESAVMAAFEEQASPIGSLTGTVRLATTDGFGAFIVSPNLIHLKATHPHLDIELVTATAHNAVSERHFDLAVTLERPISRAIRCELLGSYDLQLYAAPEYLSRTPAIENPSDLRQHTIIWYVNALLDVEPLRILDKFLHDQTASVQISNVTGHWQAARSGLGIAPLPAYIGNNDDQLVTVLPEKVTVRRNYWVVIPKELERLERVQVMVRFLQSLVETNPHLTSVATTTEDGTD
uniref:HTH lysR-type domain-containing protein n=1 Tax=Rhodococcus sp. NS1 TaxID=402236 RepID=A0A097SQU5_9NOCA|nr:hypothetical protein LRS1606.446 [Rhodococcus sp. NS1]